MQGEIISPFSPLNNAVVECLDWIHYFILHFIGYAITYPINGRLGFDKGVGAFTRIDTTGKSVDDYRLG